MIVKSLGVALVLGVTSLTVACSQNSNSDSSSESALSSSPTSATDAAQKVRLSSATEGDIIQNKVDCHGKSKNQICIRVCHRPPGNPSNYKEMVLPLRATIAHLCHGGPQIDEHDFLGSCEAISPGDGSDDNGDSGNDTGSTDEDSDTDDGTDPVDDGSGSGGDVVVAPELPIWCQRNLAIDADCDGFNDQTGESIY